MYNVDVLLMAGVVNRDNYSVVFLDAPRGNTNEFWDVAWTLGSYQKFFENVNLVNLAQQFTYCLFLSTEQFWPVADLLRQKGFIHQFQFVWSWRPLLSGGHNNNLPAANFCCLLVASNKTTVSSVFCFPKSWPSHMWSSILQFDLTVGEDFFRSSDDNAFVNASQLPLDLALHLVHMLTDSASVVLDACCGTAVISLAAVSLDRMAVCVDSDVRQFRANAQRFVALTADELADIGESYAPALEETRVPVVTAL